MRLIRTAAPVLTLCLPALAAAQPAADGLQSMPMSITAGFETLKLDQGEHLGLASGAILFETAPGWWLGPAVYGAASGQRGGFFVGGGELQHRWRFGSWTASAGFFAGGGGGGASNALVGGGLMLRPALSLMLDMGGWQTGLSASSVRFPNGHVSSKQLGWVVAMDDRFFYRDWRAAGQQVYAAERSGLGFDRMSLTLARYRPHAGSVGAGSSGTTGSMDLVGARFEQDWSSYLGWSLEADGVVHGQGEGYAEVLGGLGGRLPLAAVGLPCVSVGARAALGLGGGGAVQTHGGMVIKAAGTLSWDLNDSYRIGAEAGYAGALEGGFKSHYAQLTLGMALDDATLRRGSSALGGTPATVGLYTWDLSWQHVLHAARKSGGDAALDVIGLKFNRYFSPHIYLSAQAYTAFAGHAGGYQAGLIGGGWVMPLDGTQNTARWQAGAELLAGAAGGGGIDTQGGAITQALAWLGWRATRNGELKLGVGGLHAVRGGLSSPVLDLTWSQSFGLAGR